jgi:hypothetical protein
MTIVQQFATTDLPLEWTVEATDEPGPGGAHHAYRVHHPEHGEALTARFQCGPRNEPGSINGVFDEHLLAIVAHRMECFQAGDFADPGNQKVLDLINEARVHLNHRAVTRQRRGVLGLNVK